jgi:crossover junction endodeoxyribonuclease RusA
VAECAPELVLPWPKPGLSPNGSHGHWAKVKRLTQDARQTAVVLAYEAGWKNMPLPDTGRLYLWIDFHPPRGKTEPDDDNLIRRFKPFRDGIAQVVGINDGRFLSRPRFPEGRSARGRVVVRITTTDEAPG